MWKIDIKLINLWTLIANNVFIVYTTEFILVSYYLKTKTGNLRELCWEAI